MMALAEIFTNIGVRDYINFGFLYNMVITWLKLPHVQNICTLTTVHVMLSKCKQLHGYYENGIYHHRIKDSETARSLLESHKLIEIVSDIWIQSISSYYLQI